MNTLYYIGVDAGGSKCRARLEAADGSILGRAETGPATIRRGADFAATSILACINETSTSAGLPKTILTQSHIAVGAAGTESSSETETLLEKLRSVCTGGLELVSDAKTACIGAHRGEDGGIVIVGTGSIGYGLVGDKSFRVGGFGFPVSDLGSGAHIGLAAIQHALAFIGSTQLQSEFAAAVLAETGNTTGQVAAWAEGATATDYAGFAPLVVTHAEKGNSAAVHILDTAAEHIAELVSELKSLGAPRISLMGGLADIIALLLTPETQAFLSPPLGDAIDGAILLARHAKKQQS